MEKADDIESPSPCRAQDADVVLGINEKPRRAVCKIPCGDRFIDRRAAAYQQSAALGRSLRLRVRADDIERLSADAELWRCHASIYAFSVSRQRFASVKISVS